MRFGDAMKARLIGAVNAYKTATSGVSFVDVLSTEPYFVPPSADTLKLIELYKTSPWVRTIVHKIGRTLAKQEWYIEGKAEARIDDHPALDFIRSGTAKLRGRRAMALTSIYVDLCGEAFWGIGRDAKGVPIEYAVIPPHWVLDIPHLNYPNYKIQPRLGVIYEIEPENIFHFRDVDPTDPYGRGSGMTHAAMVELDTDKQAASFMNSFFKNRARPDIIITGTETSPLSDKDRQRGEMTWGERFRGAGKVGRGFWSTRPLNVQEIGFGLRDNQIDKIREQQRSFISEFYNIPPEILGRIDTSNRATIDSADYLFSTHVIEPRLEFLMDHLEPWCMDEFGLKQGQLTYENPAQDDTQKSLSIMVARPMAFTDDEFRELAGYKGLGGDHAKPPEPIAPAPGPTDQPPKPGQDPKPIDTNAPKPTDPGAKAIAAPVSVSKSLSPQDIVEVSSAIQDPQVVAQATKLYDDLYQQLLDEYGADLLAELESDVEFAINAAVRDWIMQRGADTVEQVDGTTEDALKAALVDGVAADESLDELIGRVEELFADAATGRAELIGETEATALTGAGSYYAAKQGGFEEKMWVSSHDQLVRASHRALDRTVIPLDSEFQSPSGATAQFPGDFGDAAEDINCRCAIRPVLPGEDTSEDKAIVGTPSFAKWHTAARDKIAKAVKAKAAVIFAAQCEVVKTQLRRSMGAHRV